MSNFEKVFIFDPDNNIPKEVVNELIDLWANNDLGNDYYYYSINLQDEHIKEFSKEYPSLYNYLIQNTPDKTLRILLHWSW